MSQSRDSFFLILITFSWVLSVLGQFAEDSSQYKLLMKEETLLLYDEVTSNDDVNLYFNPQNALINADNYISDYPDPIFYRINILVDPCKHLNYNCCIDTFGSPEYPSMKINPLEQARVYKPLLLGADDEVTANYNLVYADGTSVPASTKRGADDDVIHNVTCEARNEPKPSTHCMSKHIAFNRSSERPACNDNNFSVNALQACYYIDGTLSKFPCFQVGYSQNALIGQCSDDAGPHCGTYLELHMPNGSPYQDESVVIAEAKLETREVSGVNTTVLPLTWRGNNTKVICSYSEAYFRIGSMVYIDVAPICCCPPPFKPSTRVGSFFCPYGPLEDGPYAYKYKTRNDMIVTDAKLLKYPFCPSDLSEGDRVMCSVHDAHNQRHYVRNCSTVVNSKSEYYSSDDLDYSQYNGVCPYYDGCALTSDKGLCKMTDTRFTFIGRVGKITSIDDTKLFPTVWVTFNDGRTSYEFLQSNVKLETRKSMYEVWWVLRTKSNYIVQMRKGFNVSYPTCTFDLTNDRYFPYTSIRTDGTPVDSLLI